MTTELKTGRSTAVIASEGAELKSLVIDGREIMWCGDPAFWGKTSPVLFPAIGNVRNNKTIIGGREVSLTKHGFARDNTFSAVRKSGNSLVLQYKYNPVKNGYPYSVDLALQYNLFDDRIEISYSVFNPNYDSIPFCIGAHPAIACDNLDNCTLVFEKREKADKPAKTDEADAEKAEKTLKSTAKRSAAKKSAPTKRVTKAKKDVAGQQ